MAGQAAVVVAVLVLMAVGWWAADAATRKRRLLAAARERARNKPRSETYDVRQATLSVGDRTIPLHDCTLTERSRIFRPEPLLRPAYSARRTDRDTPVEPLFPPPSPVPVFPDYPLADSSPAPAVDTPPAFESGGGEFGGAGASGGWDAPSDSGGGGDTGSGGSNGD